MFPKKTYKKRLPTKAQRGKFSQKTIADILERDNYSCVECDGNPDDIHHVKYKSAGGRNVYTNGLTLCRYHHDLAHSSNEWRVKFEDLMIERYGNNYFKDEYDE